MTLNKLDPRYSISIRGFDRRGCVASINNTSASGFTISGMFADAADFFVFLPYDADDVFGHLYTSRYLPDFDHSGIVLDFDLAITNGMYVGSSKFPSVPWNAWSWIKADGSSGTTPLDITSVTGGSYASISFTVSGSGASPAVFDRVQLIYNSNVVFDHITGGVETFNDVAEDIKNQINAASVPFSATRSGAVITITSDEIGEAGNTIGFLVLNKNTTCVLTPTGPQIMTGGVDPTSCHITLDFTGEGLDTVRQIWLTGYPSLPIDTVSPALIEFTQKEFSYVFTNWTVTDPSSKRALKVANQAKSVAVGSRDARVKYEGVWNEENGFYFRGFAKASSVAGDRVTIRYSSNHVHDLYLGTSLYIGRGRFGIVLDGVGLANLDCALNVASQLNTRRLVATSVPAGIHTITLTLLDNKPTYFDFLHAVVADDPIAPSVTYPTVSAACDYDTDQTYKIPPSRLLWIYQQAGLLGDVDFYVGVFFALKRRRRGGSFNKVVCTVAGTLNSGTGFADGDSFFLTVDTTTLGVSVFPKDTLDTVVDRFVSGLNNTFVGLRAERTGTGELTIWVLTPINGFPFSISSVTFSGATWAKTGALTNQSGAPYGGGNEGIWEIDPVPASPLNKGFYDYLTNFATLFTAASIPYTVAFSHELLAPPDQNTIADSWIERFITGETVLTATGFGSWGHGYVDGIALGVIEQKGHGYIPGYVITNGTNFFTIATVPDADHYTLVSGLPSVGDEITCNLQTSHCNFNPGTTTAYISKCYQQSSLVVEWHQFGEVYWWFFPGPGPLSSLGMAYYDEYTKDAALASLGRVLATFTLPDDDPSVNAFADADFLRDQVGDHIATIVSDVLAVTPTAKFELLYPYDVNYKTSYQNAPWPYPIGGRMNRYTSLPLNCLSSAGVLDRIKIEALAWGTSYRNEILAEESINFPFTDTSWALADTAYLIPWQNAGCPWTFEYWKTIRAGIPIINFWALDHMVLFSWPLPLLEEKNTNEVT